MFTKLFQKNNAQSSRPPPAQLQEENPSRGMLTPRDINPRIVVHYGIPSTASILAFDPIQSLLALGTLDGRIKVIGGDNIEGLLVSPKQLPFKNLEFLQNQGFIVSVSNGNEIQVWDLEQRRIASTLQWESNITAFSVIRCSSYMYIGDEYGIVSVLKYDAVEVKLVLLPYYVPTNAIAEAYGISSLNNHSVVGVLPQPSSQGKRLLIAYEDGLIILWDVSEDKVISVRGNKDLQLKSKIAAGSQKEIGPELSDDGSDYEQVEKEISSLCWASTNGSVLAVGYVDGDIMLWNLSTTASSKDQQAENLSNDVVKLQLASGDRRLPVIVLHWSAIRSFNDCCGQLFVYGGDAIGSEEVLTILSLDWSSGIGSLKCIGRVDLTLDGAFADMVLLPSSSSTETCGTLLLTNPGQLHYYDDACLSSLIAQQKKKSSMPSMQYPMVITTVEPYMTVAKLGLLHGDGKLSRDFSEIVSASNLRAAHTPGKVNWPLAGGIPSQLFDAESYQVERVYITGYQDGSVRVWDATYPTFSLIYVIGPEVKGINIAGASASVSALEFCPFTLSLAIGNELGMIRLYKLIGSTGETSLNLIKETEKEVHMVRQGDGPQCTAVFSFLSSPICILQYVNFGTRLTVGFHCSQVAMLDISTLSVLFLTDRLSDSSSPINSLAVKSFSDSISLINYPEDIESRSMEDQVRWDVFVMTKDSHMVAIDGNTGSIVHFQSIQPDKGLTVISMHIIGGSNLISEASSGKDSLTKNECVQAVAHCGSNQLKVDPETSIKSAYFGKRIDDFLILICCEDALHLHSLKSLHEGYDNPGAKVNLPKPCCWTTTFKKDNKESGLILLYQTGIIEIRSLPDLEVVVESSLLSILRWNFKNNMEKTICSSDNAQILLVNGCEFAFLSLLAHENDLRIPESLPCLHDKVLAAAAEAIIDFPPSQKKIQGEVFANNLGYFEDKFSSPPFLKTSMSLTDNQNVVELSIDDIDIDESLHVSTSFENNKNDVGDKRTEKERLFEGATTDTNPKVRTVEEIKAKYRKEDASDAAARARNKLVERQEKLERLNQRTEELQSGAENFSSMANELVKQMEKRKWWNI